MSNFPDPSDRASEYEQFENAERIRLVTANAGPKRLPAEPGFCDECGNPTATSAHLFCSIPCRDADAHREKIRSFKGRL